MRDWKYYETNTVPLPDKRAKEREMRDEINNTRMTATERRDAMAKVHEQLKEWYQLAYQPYEAEQDRLKEEFWVDCRNELGYGSKLSFAGCRIMEETAWRDSHSNGFSEVYSTLDKYWDLFTSVRPHYTK